MKISSKTMIWQFTVSFSMSQHLLMVNPHGKKQYFIFWITSTTQTLSNNKHKVSLFEFLMYLMNHIREYSGSKDLRDRFQSEGEHFVWNFSSILKLNITSIKMHKYVWVYIPTTKSVTIIYYSQMHKYVWVNIPITKSVKYNLLFPNIIVLHSCWCIQQHNLYSLNHHYWSCGVCPTYLHELTMNYSY